MSEELDDKHIASFARSVLGGGMSPMSPSLPNTHTEYAHLDSNSVALAVGVPHLKIYARGPPSSDG